MSRHGHAGVTLAGLGLVGALGGACAAKTAAPIGPAPPPPPAPGLDMRMPEGQPEPEQLLLLPALWQREVQRSDFKLARGPLGGAAPSYDADFGPLALGSKRNPYLVPEDDKDGRRRMVERPPSEPAKTLMQAANDAFTAGKLDDALGGYRSVIDKDPYFAKAYFYVASVLKQKRDFEGAGQWVERGLRLAPRDAFGYAQRAEMQAELGQDLLARESLARAFALDPYSGPALRLLDKLGGRRPGVSPPVFLRKAGKRDLVARAGGHPAWQDFAACKALLRWDARVRQEFLQALPSGIQSPAEETTCGFLATASYRLSRGAGGPSDPDLERWSKAFDAGLLREAVIYELLGCRRPEVLQLLPDEAQTRMVEYTRVFVVPGPASAPRR